MGVDDLQFDAVNVDGHPQGAARLEARQAGISRQGAGLDQPLGQGGEDGRPVTLLLHRQGGVEAEGHAQPLGDGVGLVDAAAAGPADIDLLQGDDIRLAGRDHIGDAPHVEAPVRA